MAQETLLSKIPIPSGNVHRIEAELGADAAAIAYEGTLRDFFGASDRFPCFDLILLGLGENGHTASLFPHSRLLQEEMKWVAAEYIEEIHAERITLTAPVINNAAQVMFLVSGETKADVIWQVWNKERSVEEHPANLIAPTDGEVMWLVDDAAAGRFARVRL
jgi:6-phosphogluconolactonase